MYSMSGRAGGAVDQLNGLGCRNIITGDTTTTGGNGSLGTSGGGVPVTLTSNNGEGNHALYIRNHNEVEHIMPIWRRGTGPGQCCDGAEYDASDLFGPRQGNNWRKYYCDPNHMINSISGGASGNGGKLTNFSFSCRNFANMTNIGKNPLNCCSGIDTSQDCQDVKQYLNCPAKLKTYCGTNDNIMSDNICQTAVGNKTIGEQDANSLRFAWCSQGSNFANQHCLDLCNATTGIDDNKMTNNGENLKQQCNALYSQKCADPANQTAHGTDICSCSLPWTSYPGYALLAKIPGAPQSPQCYFAQCRSKGYLDKPVAAYSCPQCIQNQLIDVKNASNVNLQNISQSCNISQGTQPDTTTPATTTASTATSTATSTTTPKSVIASFTSSSTGSSVKWIILFFVLMFCCFSCCAGVVMFA